MHGGSAHLENTASADCRAASVFRTLHAITQAANADAVCEAVQRFVESEGYLSFAIGRDIDRSTWRGDPEIYTWPTQLVANYVRYDRVQADLGVAEIRRGCVHHAWEKRGARRTREEEMMAAILDDAGIGGGILIGIRGGVSACSVFSLSQRTPRPSTAGFVDACRLVGDAALLRLTVARPQASKPFRQLSARQLEILAWAARGKSNKDIATILGVSERNVVYHMGRTMAAIEVRSRAQAIAWLAQSHPETLLS